jgi:hypothetical protein
MVNGLCCGCINMVIGAIANGTVLVVVMNAVAIVKLLLAVVRMPLWLRCCGTCCIGSC